MNQDDELKMAEAARALLSHLDEGLSATLAQALALEFELRLADVKRAAPLFAITAEDFAAFVASRITHDSDGTLAALALDDLYLACACLKGDAHAATAFAQSLFPEIRRAAARAGRSESASDDIAQNIFVRLFSSSDPKIAQYQGKGPLVVWLRVIASREALDLARVEKRHQALSESILHESDDECSPELKLLRKTYAPAFKASFAVAMQSLSLRERSVLRHSLDGSSADDIAKIYGVHRVTVARWLSSIRSQLLVQTRAQLQKELMSSGADIDSILRIFGDQVSVSLERLLP